MTIRDPEVLEALRDEPELLALADAVAATQPAPKPSRFPRVVARSAAVVLVGAAALVAALFWPVGGGGDGVLDRALAAIGDGPVLHLVTRLPTGEMLIDLRSGRTTVPTFEVESWSDRSGRRVHAIFREDGRVVGEMILPEDLEGSGGTLGEVDPAYDALWSGYREALATGKAKLEREGTLYGRPVYWIRFPAQEDGRPGSLVAVDRTTYRPLVFRDFAGDGHRHIDYRVLLARTEPFSSSAFTRRTSAPSPLTGEGSSSSGATEAHAGPAKVTKPWLQAGPTIAGMKLSSVRALHVTTDRRRSTGVEVVYESEDGTRLTIDQFKRPDDPSAWSGIPDDFMRVRQGEESDGQGTTRTRWSGELVRDGIYVTIETGISREVLLQVARALRPA